MRQFLCALIFIELGKSVDAQSKHHWDEISDIDSEPPFCMPSKSFQNLPKPMN